MIGLDISFYYSN